MRKKLKIVPKFRRDWFGSFGALEWAWQKDFGKSIETHSNNKFMKKYPKIF